MRKDKPTDEVKFITLATKLTRTEAALFQQWCADHKMNTSQAFMMFVQCVMQYDGRGAVDNEKLRQVMQLWDEFRDINRVSVVICPGSQVEVAETIYLISEQGKRGTFPVLVEPSMMGEPQYTTSTDEIVDELFTTTSLRGLGRRLRRIGRQLETNGITDTITAICHYYEQMTDPIHEEIMQEFADNLRHDWGRSTELVKYKRHNASTVNQMEMQFDDEQGPEIQQGDSEHQMDETGQDAED